MPQPILSEYILTFTCTETPGLVHDASGFIAQHLGNIKDSAQYSDPKTHVFCMRLHFSIPGAVSYDTLNRDFRKIADRYDMEWQLHTQSEPPKVLIMVSKYDHCALELLYRRRIGDLDIDYVAIVSNHLDFKDYADRYHVPFHHLPVTRANKLAQEAKMLQLVQELRVEFVVLARYMQVLSPSACEALRGRVINIHHSFLPGFKGAKPYHQAHERGVKLIGATAHFATPDLDEGPIIEQDVTRVSHSQSPAQLAAIGRDIERRVLSRAVQYQAERRVFLNGNKTIVFA